MQTTTRRIRTIVAGVTVALAVTLVPATSPAAVNRANDTGPTTTKPRKTQPSKQRFKAAWGAGIKGYGDSECMSLMHDSNAIMDALDDAIARGDAADIAYYENLLKHVARQLDNCVVLMS
jgi:hypothetical protein